jgi:hypothetical protein
MKKILPVIITVCMFVSYANGQIGKGSVFLGGDIYGSMQKTKSGGTATSTANGITISPVFGKAIKDNLVFGVNAGFLLYNTENGHIESETKSYTGGVFLRKYKNLGTSGFYLFVQGGLGATHYKEERNVVYTTPEKVKRFIVAINAYPGISYAVSKKLHFETGFNNLLSLNYFNEKRDTGVPAVTYKTNGFSITSSLSNASSYIYLGFRVLLSK